MGPRVRIELPPALETRPTNKNRIVGAPDMPKPRRSPAEVKEAAEQKVKAKTRAAEKAKAAHHRVQDLEAGLNEDSPTQNDTLPAFDVQVSGPDPESLDSDRPRRESLKIVLPPSGPSGGQANKSGQQLEEEDQEQVEYVESEDLRDSFDSQGSPAIRTTADSDDDSERDPPFQPMDQDKSEESSSGDESDTYEKAYENLKTRGKKKRAPSARRATQAVGKRKQDAMGEPERTLATKTTGPPAPKKPRQNHSSHGVSTGLVPNWMDVISSRQPRGRSTTPATSVSIPRSTGSSRSPSRPPSSLSGGDTSEQEEGQELIEPAEVPATPTSNVSDALRYRAKAHPVFMAADALDFSMNLSSETGRDRGGPPLQSSAAITHTLTKIVPPSRIPGEPAIDAKSADFGILNKKSRKRTGNGPAGAAGTGNSSESKSVTLRHIPQSMQTLFTERFVPLARQFAGTLDPWQEVTLNEFKTLHLQAFGNLAQVHPLHEGDKCHKLIQQKLNDWRAKFATTGTETFKEILASDPDLAEVFSQPSNVGAYAAYLLGDGKGAALFFYAEWNEGLRKIIESLGRMRSTLIVGILAHHISELYAVNPQERMGDYPRGALGMAVLAAMHILTHYQSGEWSPPKGRAGWFSADNYSDKIYWDATRKRERSDKKVTNILKVIDDLGGDEWSDIIEDARKVMLEQRATSGRRSKAGKGQTAAVADASAEVQQEADGASDSDDGGLMLVNDA